MYETVNKTKAIKRYMEALSLHTWAQSVHRKKNESYIDVVEYKIVTPRLKHIDLLVFFLQEQLDNGIFVPKYERSSVMPAYMCTKPCLGLVISRITRLITGLSFYQSSYTKHHLLMKLHEIYVT